MKSPSDQDPPRDEYPPVVRRFSRRRSMVVWVLIVLAVLGLTVWRWVWLTRASSALPPAPDVSKRPAALRDALAAARSKFASGRTSGVGVAELGRLYHANGFASEAAACWRYLASVETKDGRWPYYLADLSRQSNDHESFERFLRETVRRSSSYPPAWLSLAAIAFKSGRLEEARENYSRLVALNPDGPEGRLGLARVELQLGHGGKAREILERVVVEQSEFSPAHNLLAEILAATGDVNGARRHRWLGREAGRYRDPDDPWLLELRAWCYDAEQLAVLGTMEFQTQRHDRARTLLERAASLAPENASIRVLLGELYLKQVNAASARDLLLPLARAGASAQPLPVGGYVTLADAQALLGERDQALATIEAGLTVYPDAAELFRQRGMMHLMTRKLDDATEALKTALKYNPRDAEATFQLAMVALNAGRRDEARDWLTRTLTIEPAHGPALTLLARFEMEAGRLDAAWGFLAPLYDNHWGLAQVRQLVARWHNKAGDIAAANREWSRAEGYYRAGADVLPEDAELQSSLGVLFLTQQRFTEAVAPLEAYRRIQPDAQSALFLGQTYAALGRIPEARRLLSEGEQAALQARQTATARHCREILESLNR